ncbi:MAG: class I SAM-dependent methyltransferase [Anaerolineaceae bacterium]|nr:class I SAM-dependent methyltransferase [Anaerolineaceae bacterium]
MNFDRLAAHYHWLEEIFAGGLMQRCRTTFLSHTKNCRSALLVGEGTGKFLVELLRLNPRIQITCIEQCEGMIKQARQRLSRERLDDSQIQFQQLDVLQWLPPKEKFDLVVTNFLLDCFRSEQLEKLIPLLAGSTSAEAIWLLVDFRVPERGWRRWRAKLILALLYAFFKLTTSLSASWLTPPDSCLSDAGFKLAERRLVNFGFAHADLWSRSG